MNKILRLKKTTWSVMTWIKEVFKVALVSIVTILILDIIAYPFKGEIQNILPRYGTSIENFSKGYPTNHFKSDKKLGFDINPDFKTSTFSKPLEYKKYDVWGNSYGCFDEEWSTEDLKNGIYLAGDSFTWGYTSYETKFGTILERISNTKVYACGVTHTGQAHQFKKFQKLFEIGLRPKIVLVNIASNDLDNDFFFPHTEIINGFMVENYEICGGSFKNPQFNYKKLNRLQLEGYVSNLQNQNPSFNSFLREYSLTANIIAEISRDIRQSYLWNKQDSPDCRRSVYAGISGIADKYMSSTFTIPNREHIKKWIFHSKTNDYKLIFSFIPSKGEFEDVSHPFIKQYILDLDGEYISFTDYCDKSCREKENLYYMNDGHFNEKGNKKYAEFLQSILSDLKTNGF